MPVPVWQCIIVIVWFTQRFYFSVQSVLFELWNRLRCPSFSNFVRCLSTSPHLVIVASTLFTAFPRKTCQSEDSTLRRRFPQMIFLFGLIVFVVLAEGADGGPEKKVNVPRIWLRKECQTPPTPTQGPPFIVSSDQVDISARLKSRIVQRAFGINRMKFVNSKEVASS